MLAGVTGADPGPSRVELRLRGLGVEHEPKGLQYRSADGGTCAKRDVHCAEELLVLEHVPRHIARSFAPTPNSARRSAIAVDRMKVRVMTSSADGGAAGQASSSSPHREARASAPNRAGVRDRAQR